MSYFKKFTDFCAGIAAFVASLYIIRRYLEFKPKTEAEYLAEFPEMLPEEIPSKLEQFFEQNNPDSFKTILALVILLVLSIAVGRFFKRIPALCFAVSLLPALHIIYMFDTKTEQASMYLVLGALHVVGNIVEAIIRDREDGRHRLSLLAKASSLFSCGFCLVFIKAMQKTAPEPELLKEENPLMRDIFEHQTPLNTEIVKTLAIMFGILLIVSIILYNVYFIDAIISAVPLCYSIHALYSGNLSVGASLCFLLACACFVSHVALLVFENNLSRKEQEKQKQLKINT